MDDNYRHEFLVLLELIQENLAQDGRDTIYTGLSRSINILKNKDKNGYGKLRSHLLEDFRKLYDNRHDNDFLNEKFDMAYKLSEKIF